MPISRQRSRTDRVLAAEDEDEEEGRGSGGRRRAHAAEAEPVPEPETGHDGPRGDRRTSDRQPPPAPRLDPSVRQGQAQKPAQRQGGPDVLGRQTEGESGHVRHEQDRRGQRQFDQEGGPGVPGPGDTRAAFLIELALTATILLVAYVAGFSLGLPPEYVWTSLPLGWLLCLSLSYRWVQAG